MNSGVSAEIGLCLLLSAADGEISDDELTRIEKELEKLTHDVVAEIDTLVGHKEKELLEV